MTKNIQFPLDSYFDDRPFEGTAKGLSEIIRREGTPNVEIQLAEPVRQTNKGSFGIFQYQVGGRISLSLWFNSDGNGGGSAEEMRVKPCITLDPETRILAVIHSNES